MKTLLAVLAAWLHDVGKFAQRAGAPASQRLDQELLPHGTTHRHVLYTDFFIENVLPLPPELEGERSRLARLAAAHHRPDTTRREESALQRADWLSSGGDRIEGDAEGNYKTARLESIFSKVRLNNTGIAPDTPIARYRLRPLEADDTPIFPCADAAETGSYKELYEAFCAALREIPLDMGVRHYLHSLITVLERFTWCIPSSTYGTCADISLYDHAATTAAIMQALLSCPEGEERFLLVGGDFSGIQKFIFGTEGQADKGASKLLRARSFLLQALTRSIWLSLLERLQLSNAARIMDAGGRFVLLLPDTDDTRQTVETLKNELEHWLMERFQAMIRMTFVQMPVQPEDLQRERFVEVFERFNDTLERAKLHPFSALFKEHVSPVLPVDHAGYRKFGECSLCHSRPASASEDDEAAVCPQCRQLVTHIGRRLPQAHYLIFDHNKQGVPLFGNLFLRLEGEKKGEEEKRFRAQEREALDIVALRNYTAFSAVPIAGFIPTIRNGDMERWQAEKRLHQRDGKSFLAQEPCELGAPKTFALLAEEARIPPQPGKKWRSIACLAACKADVDNLGLLFGTGFGTGKDSSFSISRFAMLARMMNHFFAAHLMRVIEREFPNIYVIFAGGDDLFVLGPWSECIEFAVRLHQDFRTFSGNNPAVTLSAGLPLIKPRLPMRALRELAENALEDSKGVPDKNAVTLFGVSVPWESFCDLLERGKWLEKLCLEETVTQGLVRRLLGYARECRDFSAGDIRKGLYLSHMAYDLARNWQQDKRPEDRQKLQVWGQDREAFPRAELSITWALYRTRISG